MERRRWTKEEDITLTDLYNSNTPRSIISRILGKGVSAIKSRAMILGLSRNNILYWTEDEINLLLNLNKERISIKEMSEKLNKTSNSIRCQLQRLKLKTNEEDLLEIKNGKVHKNNRYGRANKKYYFNENYFEKIDSHQKAYWYGFLWADGFVYRRRENYVTGLLLKDPEPVYQFKADLGSDHRIYINENSFSIRLTSEKMFKDLEKLNIIPRKTYANLRPKITENYVNSFILGMFDGDGSISINRRLSLNNYYCTHYNLSIANSKATCYWLKDVINSNLNIYSYVQSRKGTVGCVWRTNSKKSISKFADWAYKDVDFKLERKYNKFIQSGILDK